MKRLMGIDCGDVRTGIAVSDPLGILACGVGTFKAPGRRALIEIILEQAGKYEIEEFVVGNPINMNGTLGPRSEKAQAFGKHLEEITGITVVLFDERLSTANAHTMLNMTNTRGQKRKSIIDEMSACLILQSYLDRERVSNG